MPQVKCPRCGNRHLQVAVTRTADVTFDEDGDYEITDVYGGIEFDSESDVTCQAMRGCGHSGTLKEFTHETPTSAEKAALQALRERGYAVTILNPGELEGVDRKRVEDVMATKARGLVEASAAQGDPT